MKKVVSKAGDGIGIEITEAVSNNLEKAGRITPRFAELNKSLKEFIIANKNSL